MNERSPPRRPATFRLDDPGVVVTEADESSRLARGTIQITPEPDPSTLPVPIETPVPVRRGFPWGTLFFAGLAGLVLLGLWPGAAGDDREAASARSRSARQRRPRREPRHRAGPAEDRASKPAARARPR